jgi:hypothetical protein
VRNILRTFITYLLVQIHQKKKIAPEIAEKMASVKGLLNLKGISAFYPIFFMEDCKARIGDEQLTCKINNKQFEQKNNIIIRRTILLSQMKQEEMVFHKTY